MDMTWREFSLRSIGFRRREKEKWYHTREIGYASLIAGGADPKKFKKDNFIPLDGSPKGIMSESQKEAMIKARERVKEQLNGSRT